MESKRKWFGKIKEEDELRNDKKEALRAAIELLYSPDCLQKVVDAKSIHQINKALGAERERLYG